MSNTAGTIIVGVEGSGGAKEALRWAIKEARIRGSKIKVITAYAKTFVETSSELSYAPMETLDLKEQIEVMQKEVVDSVVSSIPADEVPEIKCELLKGRAADTLIQAAEGADMLVVGTRGRGGFKGLLLGSVSNQIVQHCKCPVVVVPSGE